MFHIVYIAFTIKYAMSAKFWLHLVVEVGIRRSLQTDRQIFVKMMPRSSKQELAVFSV